MILSTIIAKVRCTPVIWKRIVKFIKRIPREIQRTFAISKTVYNRTLISIGLWLLSIWVPDIWKYATGYKGLYKPFLFTSYEISITWYLRFLGDQLSHVLKAIVLYRFSRINRIATLAAKVWITYDIIDLIIFFCCFNQIEYSHIYALLPIVLIFYSLEKRNITPGKKYRPAY